MKRMIIAALLGCSVAGYAIAQNIQVIRASSAPKNAVNASSMAKSSTSLDELVVSKGDFNDSKVYEHFGAGQYAALYDYNINTKTKGGDPVTETYVTALRIGENGALFTDYLTFKADSISSSDMSDEQRAEILNSINNVDFFFVPTVVQNIPEGNITTTDQAAITIASFTEPFGEIEWQLTEESDTFAGYNVMAAIGSYGGREWKAWFTEEIPVAFGPWKLTGLPGLILKAQDSDGLHEFKLISFTKSDVPLALKKNASTVKTERAKFIEMKNRTAQNPMASINPASISEVSVLKNKSGGAELIVNGVPLRVPVNIYVPLELE
ncbi:MAG: GLPGLI family protein [Paramuribaculum sp.]|nr:GLPGLI family protein [Paramuribaculum sp.]